MSRSRLRIELSILYLFLTLLPTRIFSQTVTDTSFLAISVANAKKVYQEFIQGNAHLYNGTEHKLYQPFNEEHPYFISDDWVLGSVVYDNELNENVPMIFDLKNDRVVIDHFSSGNKIELVSKKVSSFTLHGHNFITLKPDSLNKEIQEGFYDQLYKGNIGIYARRTKLYEERIQANVLIRSFTEKNRYFLLKDGKYLPVNNKSAALDALSDRRKMLKQQMSKSRIRYKKEREKWLVTLAGFYDTLKD